MYALEIDAPALVLSFFSFLAKYASTFSQYVVEAVKNVETYLASKEKKINAKAGAPISNGYRPETEATDELRPVDAA